MILRTLGIFMLISGLASFFWVTPKQGLSANDRAAANIARMEAKVQGNTNVTSSKSNDSKFLKNLKNTQEKQVKYMTILFIIIGVGFLGSSFFTKKQ